MLDDDISLVMVDIVVDGTLLVIDELKGAIEGHVFHFVSESRQEEMGDGIGETGTPRLFRRGVFVVDVTATQIQPLGTSIFGAKLVGKRVLEVLRHHAVRRARRLEMHYNVIHGLPTGPVEVEFDLPFVGRPERIAGHDDGGKIESMR